MQNMIQIRGSPPAPNSLASRTRFLRSKIKILTDGILQRDVRNEMAPAAAAISTLAANSLGTRVRLCYKITHVSPTPQTCLLLADRECKEGHQCKPSTHQREVRGAHEQNRWWVLARITSARSARVPISAKCAGRTRIFLFFWWWGL